MLWRVTGISVRGSRSLVLTRHSKEGPPRERALWCASDVPALGDGSPVPGGDRGSSVVDRMGARRAQHLGALKKLSALLFLDDSFTEERASSGAGRGT